MATVVIDSATPLLRPTGHKSATSQTTMMNSPISGTYANRSAIAWLEAWIIPIVGSSVTRNHSQPASKYGLRRRAITVHTDAPTSTALAPATHTGDQVPGCG